MNRSLRTTSCIFLLAVGLLVPFAFARQNKFVATANTTVAPKPPEPEQDKVILVLQTRDNLITVRECRRGQVFGGNTARNCPSRAPFGE